jgi:hypothetical protein
LTIIDNDTAPLVNFSNPTYSVAENIGTATITVTLSAVSGVTATVNYATSNGSAIAGSDYTTATGTLIFTPGLTVRIFNVPIIDDALLEGNETVSLTLSSAVSATIGATNPATLTIVDNDTPTVDFSSRNYGVDEGVGTATITVTLSFASSVTTTVNYATSNGTATAGSDYVAASGILTFTPGLTRLTFSIPITNDSVVEANETVTLTLTTPGNAILGSANNPAVLTILNNDQNLIYLPIILNNFSPPQLPDLVVTNMQLIPVSGRTYQVQLTARNQSATAVTFGNNFHVNVYLNGNFTTPIVICGVQASSFSAGQTVVIPFNWCQNNATYTFPSGGAQTLRGWADAYNVVVESNETNNTLDTNVTITGLDADTAPSDIPSLPSGPLPTPTSVP